MKKYYLVALIAALLCLARPVRAEDWPWAAGPGDITGAAAVVIALRAEPNQSTPPWLDSLELFACRDAPCKRHRLDLRFVGPSEVEKETRLHYLVMDLMPGDYRLDGIRGTIEIEGRRLAFELPLAYAFHIREGRTAYLGRLEVVVAPARPGRRPGKETAIPGLRAKISIEGDGPKLLGYHRFQNVYAYDATALVRTHPNRRFLPLEQALAVFKKRK